MKILSKYKFLIPLFIIGLITINCNKNQKAVRRLSGQWKSTNIFETIGNNATDLSSQGVSYTFDFNKCKLNKDEYCNYSVTKNTPLNGTTESITNKRFYKVSDDGKIMETTDNLNNGSITIYNIVELKKKNAILKTENNNTILEIHLIKTN